MHVGAKDVRSRLSTEAVLFLAESSFRAIMYGYAHSAARPSFAWVIRRGNSVDKRNQKERQKHDK